jgi:hypothetical protein
MEVLLKPLQDIYKKRIFPEYQYRYAWEDGNDAVVVPSIAVREPPRFNVKEDDTVAAAAAPVNFDDNSKGEGKGDIYASRQYPHSQNHDAWNEGTNVRMSTARSWRNGSATAVPPAAVDEDARKPGARPHHTAMAATAASVSDDSEGKEEGRPLRKTRLEAEEDEDMPDSSDWNGCDI